MEGLVKGDVVIIPFPFSDLSASKKRPALVLANLGQDVMLCQITSRLKYDGLSIEIDSSDFIEGSLPVSSNIRPSKIFTADTAIVVRKAGSLHHATTAKVTKAIITLLETT